jgi:predicted phosphoribosyltransferase
MLPRTMSLIVSPMITVRSPRSELEAAKKLASMVPVADGDRLLVVALAGLGAGVGREVGGLLGVPLVILATEAIEDTSVEVCDLNGKCVVIIDDEVETGATMSAAIESVDRDGLSPRRPRETVDRVHSLVARQGGERR